MSVIGGADGPTAIFVASNFSMTTILIAAAVVVAIIGVGVAIFLSSRHK